MDNSVNFTNMSRESPAIGSNLTFMNNEGNFRLCRGCLTMDVKLFNIFDVGLAEDFEELLQIGIHHLDGIPQTICSFCARLLLKATAFRKQCRAAHDSLLRILSSHSGITKETLTTVTNTNIKNYTLTQSQVQIESYDPKLHNSERSETVGRHRRKRKGTSKDDIVVRRRKNTRKDNEHDRRHQNATSDDVADVRKRKNTNSTDVEDVIGTKNVINDDDVKMSIKSDSPTLDLYDNDSNSLPEVKDEVIEVYVDLPLETNEDIKNDELVIKNELDHVDLDSDYDSDTKLNVLAEREEKKALLKKSNAKIKNKLKVRNKNRKPVKRKKETADEKEVKKRNKEDYPEEIREIYRLPKKNRLDQFSKEYEVDIVMLSKEEQIQELQDKKESDKYKLASYKCEKCFKGFAMEKSHKQHMARHDESRGDFECEICGFRFKNRRRVLAHAREYHVFNYTCKICKKTYKNPHWARFHHKMHQGEKPTCKHCGEQFAHPSVLQLHVRKTHGSARCPICNIVCAKASSVQQHIALVHKVQQVTCDQCDANFESPEALTRHLSCSSGNTCDKDSRPCGVCGEGFPNEEAFHKHLQFCTPPPAPKKDYKCLQCFRPFASAQSLRNHMNYYHKRDPNTNKCPEVGVRKRGRKRGSKVDKTAPPVAYGYPTLMCEICGKNNFKFKSALRIHQSTHSRERPFKCDVCEKTFKLQMHLKLHMAVHTGEKRYECSVCAKKFRQHAHLAQHMVLHTNEMPFTCELCGKRFRFQGSHWQHMRAHEGIHRSRTHPRGVKDVYGEHSFDSL